MIAIPAVDLRDGCCVQLVGGSFADERVRIADPLSAAQRWLDAGFRRLHIVDLDAALRRGSNAPVIDQLVALDDVSLQVGGGLRDRASIDRLLLAGVERVVLGTRALREPEWLEQVARAWPGRVIVAADARHGTAVTHGWTTSLDTSVVDIVGQLRDLPIAAFLVTAVDREGLMRGPDTALMRDVVQASAVPVIASGGIGSMSDLQSLADAGVAASVIGMALYTGALDERAVAREFSA